MTMPSINNSSIKNALATEISSGISGTDFFWNATYHNDAFPYVIGKISTGIEYYFNDYSDFSGRLTIDIYGKYEDGEQIVDDIGDKIWSNISQQFVNISGSGSGDTCCIYIKPEIRGSVDVEDNQNNVLRQTQEYTILVQIGQTA
jgi:hypothetical protein